MMEYQRLVKTCFTHTVNIIKGFIQVIQNSQSVILQIEDAPTTIASKIPCKMAFLQTQKTQTINEEFSSKNQFVACHVKKIEYTDRKQAL